MAKKPGDPNKPDFSLIGVKEAVTGEIGYQQAPARPGGSLPDNMPAAMRSQIGDIQQRFPDIVSQPEGGRPVNTIIPITLCPVGFTGSTDWTQIISYKVGENRKLILVDAWVAFSNPFVAAIVSVKITNKSNVKLQLIPRIQTPCGCQPGIRLAVYGRDEISFQIKREPSPILTWGNFQAFIKGWDVPNLFPENQRMLK